jgi:hypothetical protein
MLSRLGHFSPHGCDSEVACGYVVTLIVIFLNIYVKMGV